MNCLVIDDEPLARELLESYIAKIDGLQLVGSCGHAVEAFTTLRQKHVDVIFLDIQMPQVSGIELVNSLAKKPQVIFTTAFRDYALEAYDLDVVDYLLKPIRFDRFLRSLAKLDQKKIISAPLHNNEEFSEAYLFLRVAGEMVKVYLREIVFIESLRDYVRVQTTGNDLITYQKISVLGQKLPQDRFIRTHRSFIVGLDHVTSFTPQSVVVSATKIPIGRNFKGLALKALHERNVMKR